VRLSTVTNSRANNFDVLRLAAAFLVLVHHSFPLGGHDAPLEPHNLGTLGVEVFFVISGFLVTRSWCGQPHLGAFLRKRARRILPGLVGAVTVTALVIGPAFTSESPIAFLASPAPWGYIAANASLLLHEYVLPSVFTGNPMEAANGSLWTLPVEARAYLLLGLLGFACLVRRGVIVPLAVTLLGANIMIDFSPAGRLTSLFFASSALYLLRDSVILRADVAAALFAAFVAAYTTRFTTAVDMLALPYLVVFAAYRTPARLRRLTGATGDVSYGVYLYGFPIQQAIVATLGPVASPLVLLISAPLTWLAGLASWQLVESRFLVRRRTAGLEPAASPSAASA
jgi:peptidoglycan/LPS O-acetylase OafA/YrhL